MVNIVYVHAYVKDEEITIELLRFYSQIKEGGIRGLERVQPVLRERRLDELLEGLPIEFQDAIKQHPFEGLGIWTEWLGRSDIDTFYGSPLHHQFSRYAQGTLNRAWYRVVQLREEKVSIRDVR